MRNDVDLICFGRSFSFAVFVAVSLSMPQISGAQTGTLAEPFPEPSPNAALHYQRALLHLAKVGAAQSELLSKPLWEALPAAAEKPLPGHVNRLLYQSRFATRAAASGARTANCNFGIDFSERGATTQLPHVEGMVQLGRLLALRGAHAEARGDWEEAAIIYFDGLRMGRHLTHQNTLLEALAGIEILRTNYFALARWGARCPSRPLVARSFGLLESLQRSLLDPAQVLARETSIMALEFDQLREAYAAGDWAELILESVGEEATGDKKKDTQKAMAWCVKRGVPEAVFASPSAFRKYVDQLEATAHRFAESVTACMTLPPPARLKRAQALRKKYSQLIKVLEADTLIDPVEIGALMAEHEAELTLARLALAVSASKKDGKFPPSLQELSDRFGGVVPSSPYTGEPVSYQALANNRSFSLQIASAGGLPSVDFDSISPAVAK